MHKIFQKKKKNLIFETILKFNSISTECMLIE